MFDLKNTGPAPEKMGDLQVFERVRVPLWRLVQEAEAARKNLHDRRFIDSVLEGPCVIGPGPTTRFEHCNLGDTAGDARNLFLRGAGPLMVGVVSVAGCVFEGCLFVGVGFAGDDSLVDFFLEQLNARKP